MPWPPELAELFPTPVDTVIIQADLTAVASGPLDHTRRRRAPAAGRPGVARRRRGVPVQPGLAAPRVRPRLVGGRGARLAGPALGHRCAAAAGVPGRRRRSTARQHPGRTGRPSVLQVEHAAQAAALLKHPRASELGLRQVAPTVLVAAVEEPELVALLQEAGHAPVVEDAAGRALRPPARLRLPPPARTPVDRDRPRHGPRRWPPPCRPRTGVPGVAGATGRRPGHRADPGPAAVRDRAGPGRPGRLRHRRRPGGGAGAGAAGPGRRCDAGGGPGQCPGRDHPAGPHLSGVRGDRFVTS